MFTQSEWLWTHCGTSSRSCLLISPDLRETNISSPHRPHQRMEQTSGLIHRSRAALGTLSPFRDLGFLLWPPLLLLLVDPPLASDPLATLYLRNRVLDTWTEAPLLPQSLSQPLPPTLLQKANKRSEFRSCLESGGHLTRVNMGQGGGTGSPSLPPAAPRLGPQPLGPGLSGQWRRLQRGHMDAWHGPPGAGSGCSHQALRPS